MRRRCKSCLSHSVSFFLSIKTNWDWHLYPPFPFSLSLQLGGPRGEASTRTVEVLWAWSLKDLVSSSMSARYDMIWSVCSTFHIWRSSMEKEERLVHLYIQIKLFIHPSINQSINHFNPFLPYSSCLDSNSSELFLPGHLFNLTFKFDLSITWLVSNDITCLFTLIALPFILNQTTPLPKR